MKQVCWEFIPESMTEYTRRSNFRGEIRVFQESIKVDHQTLLRPLSAVTVSSMYIQRKSNGLVQKIRGSPVLEMPLKDYHGHRVFYRGKSEIST